jgi:hypothetical protein
MVQNSEIAEPVPVSDAEAAAGARVFTALYNAVSKLPSDLQALLINSASVLPTVLASVESELGLPLTDSAAAVEKPEVNPIAAVKCAGDILNFISNFAVPGADFLKIVKDSGGIVDFAKLFVRFATGKVAAGMIGDDALKLFDSLLGVDGLVTDCSAAFG